MKKRSSLSDVNALKIDLNVWRKMYQTLLNKSINSWYALVLWRWLWRWIYFWVNELTFLQKLNRQAKIVSQILFDLINVKMIIIMKKLKHRIVKNDFSDLIAAEMFTTDVRKFMNMFMNQMKYKKKILLAQNNT